jgi:hypothetical protein
MSGASLNKLMMSRGLVEQSVKKEKIKDKKKVEQETEETSCNMIQVKSVRLIEVASTFLRTDLYP